MAMMISRVSRVKSSHPYLENDPSSSLVSHRLRISPWLRFSSSAILNCWVKGFQLDARVIGGEAPVHSHHVPVALVLPGVLNRILEGLIPGIPAGWVQSSVGSGMRMIWTSRRLRPGSSWVPMANGVTVWPVALASSAARWAARSTSCCWMVMEISARM